MSTEYFRPKNQEMAVLNECNYKNLARILTSLLARVEFFNGTVSCREQGGVTVNLRTTLLVYRSPGREARPGISSISDIVPVWCECEVRREGRILSNDFCWDEFRKFLPPENGRI